MLYYYERNLINALYLLSYGTLRAPIVQNCVVMPLLHTANVRLGGTKGSDKTGHMAKEESPLVHIAKPVCMEGSCAKGLSLPLPDLNTVDDFVTISALAFIWS